MIQNISIERLCPHPDNPRKDTGDLSELAESIKARGVLQNLTVVAHDDDFRIVIGHRRHEAAKLAGLTELPCVIAEMDHKEQVATMLLENMQRVDLTLYEQAQGFQMMLDFGESVADIAEKTGFSETTVRRRVKLMELDPETFKESASRNATIMDFIALEKIKDIEKRNEVLATIGTPNFNNALERALGDQQRREWLERSLEVLETFASEVEGHQPELRWIKGYQASNDDAIEVPEDAGEEKYYYSVSPYGYITLYGERQEGEEDSEAARDRQLAKELRSALKEVSQRSHKLRRAFALDVSNEKAKKHMATILKHYLQALHEGDGYYLERRFIDLFLRYDDQTDDDVFEWVLKGLPTQSEKHLFLLVYSCLENEGDYFFYDGSHCENSGLDRVYDFLLALGYQISDEELAMQNGTHELLKGRNNDGKA